MAPSGKLLDWFKPLRSEAVARLRTNSVGLVGLAILSHLLPVPSPWRAFDVVWGRNVGKGPYYYICAAGESLQSSHAWTVRLSDASQNSSFSRCSP